MILLSASLLLLSPAVNALKCPMGQGKRGKLEEEEKECGKGYTMCGVAKGERFYRLEVSYECFPGSGSVVGRIYEQFLRQKSAEWPGVRE